MLFESSPLPMWVLDDAALGLLAVNDAALKLYGYSREEFLARSSWAGGVERGTYRHATHAGDVLDVEAVSHRVMWRGRAARLVVITDITERLRTQRALEQAHERLRALSRRLLEVQEQERRRLARDLHDDIGQALTALKIQLESHARPEDCVDTVRHTLERVRQLSLSLRPSQLDDLGLVAALRSHLDRQARVAGLAAHADLRDAPRDLAGETETACFRVAQEAINNVVRHAQAKNVWVRLYEAGGRLALSVRDDGAGFDLEAARRSAAAGASLGLISMEERIAVAGGSLELNSAPGGGTTVLAMFPLARAGRERAA
jgi:two-component system sensor histidine kinase UhpB